MIILSLSLLVSLVLLLCSSVLRVDTELTTPDHPVIVCVGLPCSSSLFFCVGCGHCADNT